MLKSITTVHKAIWGCNVVKKWWGASSRDAYWFVHNRWWQNGACSYHDDKSLLKTRLLSQSTLTWSQKQYLSLYNNSMNRAYKSNIKFCTGIWCFFRNLMSSYITWWQIILNIASFSVRFHFNFYIWSKNKIYNQLAKTFMLYLFQLLKQKHYFPYHGYERNSEKHHLNTSYFCALN